jgi:hypothetical protein
MHILMVIFRFLPGKLSIDCLRIRVALFGGGNGLENGRTSGRLPLSAKVHAGRDQLTKQSPKHLQQLRALYITGYLTPRCKDLRCGLAPTKSSYLHSFGWRTPDSTPLINTSSLATGTCLDVTKKPEYGRYYHWRNPCVQLFVTSTKRPALGVVGFAIQSRAQSLQRILSA